MLDFVNFDLKEVKKGHYILEPDFNAIKSKDLMVRGQAFYAVWDEEKQYWITNEFKLRELVDRELDAEYEKLKKSVPENINLKKKSLRNFSNKKWLEWKKYLKTIPDNFHDLDAKVTFQNSKVKKEDYISRRLDYPIKECRTLCYDELISTLYDKSERDKLEWAIGSIISGDSKKIQKFIVLYGSAGTGKSTVLNIIQELFDGYYSVFEAKEIGQANNMFALEQFKNNPLVAIQHDGDLSRIEDNTKLNSIVSHEYMVMNEKHKSQYRIKLNSFLIMGTNKPVRITEAKSGIIRRLIDVSPSGRKIPFKRYQELMGKIKFELPGIAYHCLEKYKSMGMDYYDDYKPTTMIGATNDFYNFMEDNYEFFLDPDGVPLNAAWSEYKKYCIEANINYPFPMRAFKEELKNYFDEFLERSAGRYKVYRGLKKDKFVYTNYETDNDVSLKKSSGESGGESSGKSEAGATGDSGNTIDISEEPKNWVPPDWLNLKWTKSDFDEAYADCPAQYGNDEEIPVRAWVDAKTKLSDLDTKKIHYILVPGDLICIDFDIKDKEGKKDRIANLMAAAKWPETYAEYSKSGTGLHLYYIYDGDVTKLMRIYEPDVEVKVFTKKDGSRGYSSLRRALTFCNNLPISTISSGLPLRGEEDVYDKVAIKNEKGIRTLIIRNLNKEYHGYTKPSVDFIFKILDDAYKGDLSYDVSDLRQAVLNFAMGSHNNANYCTDLVAKMKFMSKDFEEKLRENSEYEDIDLREDSVKNEAPIIFFDIEVLPNLLLVCWKYHGTPREQVVKMFNPTQEEVKDLFKFRLIGFNNRKYDNHILYAAYQGYSNQKIYKLSHDIIHYDRKTANKDYRGPFIGQAYNISYTDIYDFAAKKQSLKKWEIELGIHHQEMGIDWDQPLDESLWPKLADYCVNDVMATEALFDHLKEDWTARQILADLAGGSTNDTTNTLTMKIVFGDEKKPQLVYTDLATGEQTVGR